MKTIADLCEKAETIFNDPELDWEQKYELIFSMDIWQKFRAAGISFYWYDPDTTYEEDVTAYMETVSKQKPAGVYIDLESEE